MRMLFAAVLMYSALVQAVLATTCRFDFGSGRVADGYQQVRESDLYSQAAGYGFEPGATPVSIDRKTADALRTDFITARQPFLFSVKLPEGNYRVTVVLGDQQDRSATTVKAELRRLMLENVTTEPGRFQTVAFTVNIRTPAISEDKSVRLKSREKENEMVAWDDKLTLELNGDRPCVCAIEIEPVDVPTVYLIGDSTVCDQPNEPWNSWGQMLPRFFKPEVAVANHAQSGESIRSSLGAGRFDKIWSTMRRGDYLFIQFGHNDMKDKRADALETYTSNLRAIVEQVQRRGATAVLVTSMERKAGIDNDTLGEYPARVRQVAAETGATLIDLHKTSKVLYRALGPDLDKAFQDGTHHNAYGSYQLAKCIVQAVKESNLDLAHSIVDDFQGFDPAKPDLVNIFRIPASPAKPSETPLGS